jgi:hypothetical protein
VERLALSKTLVRAIELIAGIAGLVLIGADWIIFPVLGLGQSWWRLVGLGSGFILVLLAIRIEQTLKQRKVEAQEMNAVTERGNGAAI